MSMNLSLAIVTREVAFAISEDTFEVTLDLFDGDAGLNLDWLWDAVTEILRPDVGGEFWGGEDCSEELVYGPAQFLSPERVTTIAGQIASLTESVAATRLDDAVSRDEITYPDV